MPSVICSEINYCKQEIADEILSNLPGYEFIFSISYNYVFKRKVASALV